MDKKTFICRYCGEEKPWEYRDYDMGIYLAKLASFQALGHTEYVVAYLICQECSERFQEDLCIAGWEDA